MRRNDRAMNEAEIYAFIALTKVCRIAMHAEDESYIVPLNFGHRFCDSQLNLFFHSALEGKKIAMLRQNPRVCFEMDGGHELIEGKTPCAYSYSYTSIIGRGEAVFVDTPKEKAAALNAIMKQQTGAEFSFSESELRSVCVFKIVVSSIEGKKR